MSLRTILCTVSIAAVAVSSSAAITGKIVTKSSTPVAGATVTLLNSHTKATTGADGTFSLAPTGTVKRNITARANLITVSSDVYSTTIRFNNAGAAFSAALFSMNGRKIAGAEFTDGSTLIRLPAVTGTTLLQIVGPDGVSIAKIFPNPRGVFTLTANSCSRTTFAKTAALPETLLVAKDYYVGKRCVVTTADEAIGDITITNVDSVMTLIPARDSTFQMGSALTDARTNEQPVHAVSFTRNFYMDSVEVTQASYNAVVGKTPWVMTTNSDLPYCTGDAKAAFYHTWGDAVIYCNARSKRDGLDTVYSYLAVGDSAIGQHCVLTGVTCDFSKRGYRLPTEAEWEYSCRAGTTTRFFWGNDTVGMNSYTISRNNSKDLGKSSTYYGVNPVGTKLPNAFGLYDILGNVGEMCNDYFKDTYDSSSPIDPTGPQTGTAHIYRGGSWDLPESFMTSSFRATIDVSWKTNIGFRCVITGD